MSIKRSHPKATARSSSRDEAPSWIDKEDFYHELRKRAESNEPFRPAEVATAIGAAESTVARHLLTLVSENMVERAEGGMYRSGPLADNSLDEFTRAIGRQSRDKDGKRDKEREKELAEIARLRSNNDIMRERLLRATAERDHLAAEKTAFEALRERCLDLLRQHGIDPGDLLPPAPAPPPVDAALASPEGETSGSAAEGATPVPADPGLQEGVPATPIAEIEPGPAGRVEDLPT